jgi:ABC-type bacteriocin/lantibiotic exporter with double-glycine peptidase domain
MKGNRNTSFIFFSLLVLAAACPASHHKDFKEEMALHPDRGHYILGVPFYPQEDAMCGPASLAAVLNYYGVEATPGEIASEYFSAQAGGVFPIDLELFARDKGLFAKSYAGDIQNLRAEILKDHPLVIFQNLAIEPIPLRHFAVVVGFYTEPDKEWIILYSGQNKDLLMPLKKFQASWQRTGRWTLLVLREEEFD